jgi:hypothetical protein
MGQFEDANLEIGFGVVFSANTVCFFFRFCGILIFKKPWFLTVGRSEREGRGGWPAAAMPRSSTFWYGTLPKDDSFFLLD